MFSFNKKKCKFGEKYIKSVEIIKQQGFFRNPADNIFNT